MQKVLAVVGATASGKTALGVELAKRLDGEIISADSMQVYEGLDIATAKPTQAEMQGIPHHLIGVIPRTQRFSVADYAVLAREKIQEVAARGKLPILVGGTGLYIDTVLSGMQLPAGAEDRGLRETLQQRLAAEGAAALHAQLAALDPEAAAAIHPHNTVRVVRALEVCLTTGKTFTQYRKENAACPAPYDSMLIGLSYEREVLYRRIDRRVEQMMAAGLVEEVRAARDAGMQTAAAAIGYKELLPYLDGAASLADCMAKIQQETRRYAKRQCTWFRRNAQIHWLKMYENDEVRKISEKAEKMIAKSKFLWYNG